MLVTSGKCAKFEPLSLHENAVIVVDIRYPRPASINIFFYFSSLNSTRSLLHSKLVAKYSDRVNFVDSCEWFIVKLFLPTGYISWLSTTRWTIFQTNFINFSHLIAFDRFNVSIRKMLHEQKTSTIKNIKIFIALLY